MNARLALDMYGAATESQLRSKLYGSRSGIEPEELEEICLLLSKHESPIYGEIGVYFGGTFRKVLDFLKENKKAYHAYGFDLFEDLSSERFGDEQTHELYNKWNILNVAFKEGLENKLDELGHTNFNLVKGSSEKTVCDIDKKFNVFFIDGNHTYQQAKLDFNSVIKKCEAGSSIIFDNSSSDMEPDVRYVEKDGGPWKVCQELKSDPRVKFIKKMVRCTYFKVIKS